MLMRSLVVTLGFAVVLTALSFALHDVALEPQHFGWALLLSVPIGLGVYLGGLGTDAIRPPSAALLTIAFWTATMAPSYILESGFRQLDLYYSDDAIDLGRWLFVTWCFVFILAAGRAPQHGMRAVVTPSSLLAIAVPVVVALQYVLVRGRFTNYQGGDTGEALTSDLVFAISIGKIALVCLPGFLLGASVLTETRTLARAARLAILPTLMLLVLTGGRGALAAMVGIVFLFARHAGMQLRVKWAVGALVALPLLSLVMYTYRVTLGASTDETASLEQLTSVASETTRDLAVAGDQRGEAVDNFSSNLRMRLAMGPQFFTVVQWWMESGPAYEGTFQEGMIRVLPNVLFPGKNELAVEHNFELALMRTGRFPWVDLAPTPWMQWLYELGFVGVVIGGALYGLLVRLMERRIARSRRPTELLFHAYLLSVVLIAETTSDALLINIRDALVLALLCELVTLALRRVNLLARN